MYRSERIPYGNEADDRVTLQHKTDIIDVIVTFELSAPFISSSKTDSVHLWHQISALYLTAYSIVSLRCLYKKNSSHTITIKWISSFAHILSQYV